MTERDHKDIHPEAEALVAFWERERGDKALPSTGMLDPFKLRRWIGDVSIIDIHEGPKRYFVRLHGGRTQERVGNNMARRYFEDELDVKTLEFAVAPYRASEKSFRPTHSLFVPDLYPSVFTKLERLVLPISGDDGGAPKVDHFLTWVGPTGRTGLGCDSVYEMVQGGGLSAAKVAEAVELEVLSA